MSQSARSRSMPDIIALPVHEYAYAIEEALKPYFIPYPEGIYSDVSEHPVITGQAAHQYKNKGKDRLAFIPNLGNFVVVGKVTKVEQDDGLFRQPQLPFRGLAIVRKFIEASLYSKSKWVKYSKSPTQALHDAIGEYFRPEIKWQEGEDNVQLTHALLLEAEEFAYAHLRTLSHLIDAYKGDHDEWSYYDIKGGLFSMIVKRAGDFRILDWEEKFGDQYKK